ncbi:hypothetical protein BJV82DRAFT_663227 [Fennellomyces sp. T-0311]|nr:hypothetical protein BJV82DRAFT_663227 [Fennellomyces sp. T-0311]
MDTTPDKTDEIQRTAKHVDTSRSVKASHDPDKWSAPENTKASNGIPCAVVKCKWNTDIDHKHKGEGCKLKEDYLSFVRYLLTYVWRSVHHFCSIQSPRPFDAPLRVIPVDQSTFEPERAEAIRNLFAGRGFSHEALNRRCAPLFRASVSNHGFSATDMVNFLSAAYAQGYSTGAIMIFRSAILVFHQDRITLCSDPDIIALLRRLTRDVPPRPVLDITPTLRYLGTVAAFLLSIAGFLRPSGLHPIQLTQCRVDNMGVCTYVSSHPTKRMGADE